MRGERLVKLARLLATISSVEDIGEIEDRSRVTLIDLKSLPVVYLCFGVLPGAIEQRGRQEREAKRIDSKYLLLIITLYVKDIEPPKEPILMIQHQQVDHQQEQCRDQEVVVDIRIGSVDGGTHIRLLQSVEALLE